jgi:hypothetical protein
VALLTKANDDSPPPKKNIQNSQKRPNQTQKKNKRWYSLKPNLSNTQKTTLIMKYRVLFFLT